jgi:hypothetical protein
MRRRDPDFRTLIPAFFLRKTDFSPTESAFPCLTARDGGDVQVAGANLGHGGQSTKCFFNNLPLAYRRIAPHG